MAGNYGYGSLDPGELLGSGEVPYSLRPNPLTISDPDLARVASIAPTDIVRLNNAVYNPLAPSFSRPVAPVEVPEPTNFDLTLGDSIGVQQIRNKRIWGGEGPQYNARNPAPFDMWHTAAVGDPPNRIKQRFDYLLDQNPDYFRGKNVFLPIGSNDTSQLDAIRYIVQSLKETMGANNVVVPGVGPGVKNADAFNTALKKIVEDNGFTFFQPKITWAKDGVHPANSQEMFDQANTALNAAMPTPSAPGPAPAASLVPQPTPPNALSPPATAPEAYTGPHQDIYAGAGQFGVDPALVMATASIESRFGLDPETNRPGKTYRGIFQLGPDEWAEMGGGDRDDRALQIDHGIRLLALRKQQLAEKLGREPTNAEVYLAHQQGVAGATALINNPNMPAGQAVTMAGGRPANIESNGGTRFVNAPSSEFVKHWSDMYDRHLAGVGKMPPYTPVASGAYGSKPQQSNISGGYGAGLVSDMVPPNLGKPGTPSITVPQVAVTAPPPNALAPKAPPKEYPTVDVAREQEMMRRLQIWGMLGEIIKGMKTAPGLALSGYDPGKVGEASLSKAPVDTSGLRAAPGNVQMQSPVTGGGQIFRVRPVTSRLEGI